MAENEERREEDVEDVEAHRRIREEPTPEDAGRRRRLTDDGADDEDVEAHRR
jgi:hypothetical protein